MHDLLVSQGFFSLAAFRRARKLWGGAVYGVAPGAYFGGELGICGDAEGSDSPRIDRPENSVSNAVQRILGHAHIKPCYHLSHSNSTSILFLDLRPNLEDFKL